MICERATHTAPTRPLPRAVRPRTAPGGVRHPRTAARALKRLLVPGGVLAAAGSALGLVGVLDPNEPGHYPVCPLRYATGVWCPGCGGLRSAHALVHGDLPAALGANALLVIGCLVCAALWTAWAARSLRGLPMRVHPGPLPLWASGALVTAFTIVRNLPFGGWFHP